MKNNGTAIIKKLDRLAEFHARRDMLSIEKQGVIESILPPEIKVRLDEIEAEYGRKAMAVNENISELESEIKTETLQHGGTIHGSSLMAVYSKGRVSWNDDALQGYMKVHREIEEFRKQGEPSISIRKNGKS